MADFDANFMQGPMDEIGLVKLSGSIERVIYANDENVQYLCSSKVFNYIENPYKSVRQTIQWKNGQQL